MRARETAGTVGASGRPDPSTYLVGQRQRLAPRAPVRDVVRVEHGNLTERKRLVVGFDPPLPQLEAECQGRPLPPAPI